MLNDLPLMDLRKLFFLALLLMRSCFGAPSCSSFLLLLVLFRVVLSSCELVILLMSETRSLKMNSLGNKFQARRFLSIVISPSY